MGVHEFFEVGADVDELADAAADVAFEFGGGGKGGVSDISGVAAEGGKGRGIRKVTG